MGWVGFDDGKEILCTIHEDGERHSELLFPFFFPLQLRRSGYSRMYICGFIAVSFIITIT